MSSDEFGESPGDFQVWFGKHLGIPIKKVPRWYIDWCIHPDQETFHWVRDFRYLSVRLMPFLSAVRQIQRTCGGVQ
ncbi:hypothetical protein BDN71DRAFT_1442745 [Pleurotus eryngii]|uniref:Uncharacterized protein n=1 Tax=Pleurotus eryngii TaxID=5323 RepID=A0A9P6DA27_PLEER|nr:hypothetical protein BDN71DRAFT_1442745 [Pleurotus eryngii]